jgi:hypothetical protein
MLMGMRMCNTVVLGDGAQLVLNTRFRLAGCNRLGNRLFLGNDLTMHLPNGLGLTHGRWLGNLGGLVRRGLKGGTQVSTAIGAETDATGQLLATTVTELGIILLDRTGIGGVAVRGIRVIAHDEHAVLIGAHGKALRAHDLAVVYHQLLLRYSHPFTALWAL